MDLLGGEFAADLGGAGLGPMAGGSAGNPLGLPPPKRTRKSGSNKTLFIVLGSLAGVALLVVCGGIGVALLLPAVQAARQAALRAQARNGATSAAPVGPVWAPDANLAGQLTVEVVCDRYSLRLPAGFASMPPPPSPPMPGGRLQKFVWAGQPQPNGTRHGVVVFIVDTDQAFRSSANELEMALSGAISQIKASSGLIGFTNTPGELGQLAGKQFIRSRYSGSHNGIQMHGTILFMVEGARMLSVSGMCSDGAETPGYQLLDAALLTLRQK